LGTSYWEAQDILSGLSTMKHVQSIRIVTKEFEIRERFEVSEVDISALIECKHLVSLQIPNWKIIQNHLSETLISTIKNRGGLVTYKSMQK
jgi:hypothetical protein